MRQTLQLRRIHWLSVAIIMGLPSPSFGQTWTGAVNGFWNNAGNWSPGIPVSNQNTVLTFGAPGVFTSLTNNLPGGTFNLNRVNFTSAAAAYVISGNPLNFQNDSGASQPIMNIEASTLIQLNTNLTLTGNLLVNGGSGTLSLGGAISGAGSITKAGASTLILASATNSFSGGVSINGGTIQLGAGTAVPTASNVAITSGQFNIGSHSNVPASALGTVNVNSGGTFRVPSGSGDYHITNLAMNGGTIDLTGTTAFDLHMVAGSSGVTVGGDSTWTGAGSSRLMNDTAAPLPINFSSGFILTSTINLANGTSGQGFRVTGTGGLFLNNATGNSADLIVDGGGARIQVSDMAALGSGTLTLMNNGRLFYDGPTATSAKTITLGASFGGDIAVSAGTNLTLSGAIGQSSAGQPLGIVFGTVTLSGANTFSGELSVFGGGTVSVATINDGGVAGPLGMSSNAPGNLELGATGVSTGTLQYTGSTAATNRGFTVNTGGGTIEVMNAGTTLTVNGQALGSGSLTKAGPGTLVFTGGTNNYSGVTTVNAGTLRYGSATALPLSGLVVNAGTLDLNGFSPTNTSLSGAGGTVSLGNQTLSLIQNFDSTFSGNVVGTGTLNKQGVGVLTLAGTGNTANLQLTSSYLRVDSITGGASGFGALGSGSLTLNSGVLQYGGPTASTAKVINLAGSFPSVSVLDPAATLTLTSAFVPAAGTAFFEKAGPGTLVLTAPNSQVSGTSIRAGILEVAADNQLGAAGTALNFYGGTLRFGAAFNLGATREVYLSSGTATFDTNGFNVTLANALNGIGGIGGFAKAGPGTLLLTNTTTLNIYTGGTFVNGGTLMVGADGPVIPAGRNVTVATAGVFNTGGRSNTGAALGTVTLNGGLLAIPDGTSNYFINQLTTGNTGGTVQINSPSGFSLLTLVGSNARIEVNGNSTWTGTGGGRLVNQTGGELEFRIAPGVQLNNSIITFGDPFRFTGGGTISVTQGNLADLIIGPVRYRFAGTGFTTSGALTLDGGTLEYTGISFTFSKDFTIDLGGGTLSVADPATNLTLTSNITGPGRFTKSGPGTLILNNNANLYAGGITVDAGRLDIASDALLGLANPTVNAAGTLRYTANTSTARTFNLNNGSLEAPSGLTLNGATVNGGFLRGGGFFSTVNNAALNGVTTFSSANVIVAGPATFTNFANNGFLNVTAGQTATMNYATNSSAGRMLISGTATVSDFVSNGLLTIPAGGLVNNTGSLSNMILGGGSTTFVGAVGNLGGKIDLGGQQLHVRGGLLVTNAGTFGSGNGVRNGQTVADYGALVKGTGPYQSVITQNGGQYLPGNSPGTSQVGDFFINPGGNLIFQITDAGPSLSFPGAPGTAGNNPGWGLTQVFTSMNFTATPASPFTITMQTQLPPPAAPDTPGLMSSFDPNRAYQWLIFDLQPGAVFNGTFDPNAINFATAQFVNSTMGGAFSLARTGGQIFLTFTPVPEPVGILGAAAVALGGFGWWRRKALPSKTRVAASRHI